MGDVALLLGLVGYLAFGFILTVALARLALAMAELADRLGTGAGEPKDDHTGRPGGS